LLFYLGERNKYFASKKTKKLQHKSMTGGPGEEGPCGCAPTGPNGLNNPRLSLRPSAALVIFTTCALSILKKKCALSLVSPLSLYLRCDDWLAYRRAAAARQVPMPCRSRRRRQAPTRYSYPFSSLPFPLCGTEHPNPNFIFYWVRPPLYRTGSLIRRRPGY
jgi:hypothetical protein